MKPLVPDTSIEASPAPERLPRVAVLLLLAAICVGQSTLAYRWMSRNGFVDRPFVTDAAWYRIEALGFQRAFVESGFTGWLRAGLAADTSHPPTTPMLVGLTAALRGDAGVSYDAAFLTIQAFAAAFILGSYLLARRFLGRRAAVAAAALVASTPVFIPNLRPFFPQMPMAAMLVWTSHALLAADGFSRRGPSLAAGLLAGMATMVKMLAPLYCAGTVAAALLLGLLRPGPKRRPLQNAALAAAGAGVVLLPWYAQHWRTVWYYTAAVTGEEGQERYSAAMSAGSLARWLYYPYHFLNSGLGWLIAVPFLVAALWGIAVLVRASRRKAALSQAASARLCDGLLLLAAPAAAFVPLTLGQTAARAFYVMCFVPFAVTLLVRFVVSRRSGSARVGLSLWLVVSAVLYQLLGQRPPEGFDGNKFPALIDASPTWRSLTPLDDRRSRFPDAMYLPVSADKSVYSKFPLDVLPRIDEFFGNSAKAVRAEARAPGESWPIGEFVDAISKDRPAGTARIVMTSSRAGSNPYFGHVQFLYEVERSGRDVSFTHFEDLLKPDEDGNAGRVLVGDYLVVDDRPLKGLYGIDVALADLAIGGAEGVVLLRARPTAFCEVGLIKVVRPGAASRTVRAEKKVPASRPASKPTTRPTPSGGRK